MWSRCSGLVVSKIFRRFVGRFAQRVVDYFLILIPSTIPSHSISDFSPKQLLNQAGSLTLLAVYGALRTEEAGDRVHTITFAGFPPVYQPPHDALNRPLEPFFLLLYS